MAYGKNSLHPTFTITADVYDEDDVRKLKAYPMCTMSTGPARKVENGADEVAEVEARSPSTRTSTATASTRRSRPSSSRRSPRSGWTSSPPPTPRRAMLMAEAKKTTRARTTRAKAAAKPVAPETVKALVLKTFIDRHAGERVEEDAGSST